MINRTPCIVLVAFATTALLFAAASYAANESKDLPIDTSKLVINAEGCIATGPDGKPFKLPVANEAGQILIPKGSHFSEQCFASDGNH